MFANNSFLETIDISNNHIVYMPSDSFVGLDSLQILDLSKNKIQRIENGTFSLKTLQILKLSDNKICNISENAFESLQALETLLLERNKLQSIPTRLFQNVDCLTFLDLSSNNLMSVSLWSIRLKYNTYSPRYIFYIWYSLFSMSYESRAIGVGLLSFTDDKQTVPIMNNHLL